MKKSYYTVINTVDNTTVCKVSCINKSGKTISALQAKEYAARKYFKPFPQALVLPYLITIL